MKRVRELLGKHYIGAIAVGYLVARGVEAFFGAFMPTFNSLLTEALTGTKVERTYWQSNVRGMMISNLVLTAAYFTVAFLMGSWLYEERVEVEEQPDTQVT